MADRDRVNFRAPLTYAAQSFDRTVRPAADGLVRDFRRGEEIRKRPLNFNPITATRNAIDETLAGGKLILDAGGLLLSPAGMAADMGYIRPVAAGLDKVPLPVHERRSVLDDLRNIGKPYQPPGELKGPERRAELERMASVSLLGLSPRAGVRMGPPIPRPTVVQARAGAVAENAIRREGMTPAQVRANAAADPGAAGYQAGGDQMAGVAKVVAHQPGPGRVIVTQAAKRDQARVANAAKVDIESSLGGRGDYQATLNALGDNAQGADALRAGRGILQDPADGAAERLRELHAGWSDPSRALFSKGAGEAMLGQLRASGDGVGAVGKMFDSEELSDRLRLALPKDGAYDRFRDAANRRAAEQARNAEVLRPSYDEQAARADLEARSRHPLDIAANIFEDLSPGGIGGRVVSEGLNALPRRDLRAIADPATNETLGRALADPQDLSRLLNLLEIDRARRAAPRPRPVYVGDPLPALVPLAASQGGGDSDRAPTGLLRW